MSFLVSMENEILLVSAFDLFEKICSLIMSSEIQSTHFHHHFLIPLKIKTKNNQIKHSHMISYLVFSLDNKSC